MAHTTLTAWSGAGNASEHHVFYHSAARKKRDIQKHALAICLVVLLAFVVQSAITVVGLSFSGSRLAASSSEPSLLSPKPPSPAIASVPVRILEPPKDTTSPRLQALLDEWSVSHVQHQWAVKVEGLGNDNFSAGINTAVSFRSASIYKLYLTYSLFKKETPQTLQTKLDLVKCVDLMLRISDNVCAETVGNYVGWASTDKLISAAGFSSTKLALSTGPVSTPADTVVLLRGLYDGSLYNSQSRQYILDILKVQTWRKGIPTGCGDCTVYNKTGDLGFVRHDAAIIETPAHKYALSIFTDGASYSEIAELAKQINDAINQPG